MNSPTDLDLGRSPYPMETQRVATPGNDRFPFTALRLLGSLQIALGLLSASVGAVDLSFLLINYQNEARTFSARARDSATFDTLASLTLASAPVWCGAWYSVTGLIGWYISRERPHSLRSLKTAFLVLSALCAVIFAPAGAAVSGLIAVMRHTLDYSNLIWLASTTAAFLSVCELVIAIVSASVCCCCSPLRLTKVHVLYPERVMPTTHRHPFGRDPTFVRAASTPLPAPTRTVVREMEVQTEPPSHAPTRTVVREMEVQTEPPKLPEHGPPSVDSLQRRTFPPLPRPPEEALYPEYSRLDNLSCSTSAYTRLKKLALPYDDSY